MAEELADRLDSAATPGAMLDVLEAALLARVRPVAGLGLVLDTSTRISRSAGSLSIASLTEAAGVSSTHLAAHRAGYHHQPHFNHELRRFTGLTPTGYLDLRRRFAAEHPASALDVGLLPPG